MSAAVLFPIPARLCGDGIGSVADRFDHARTDAADRLQVLLDANGNEENRLDYLDLAAMRFLRTHTAEQLVEMAREELRDLKPAKPWRVRRAKAAAAAGDLI